MRFFLLAILCLSLPPALHAQCKKELPFTTKGLEEVSSVYQFTFLHAKPTNTLDSLVLQAMYPNKIVDSNYYDWNAPYQRVVVLTDFFQYAKVVDKIGQLQSDEAFLLLCLPYISEQHLVDDMSPYHALVSSLGYYGASIAINKYFLSNAISTTLSRPEFDKAVIALAIPLCKKRCAHLKICIPLDAPQQALFDMKQMNSAPYDRAVYSILQHFLLPNKPASVQVSRDSILMQVLQLPFVHDADWNTCSNHFASSATQEQWQLGVLFNTGKDYFDQNIYLLRVYTIVSKSATEQWLHSTAYATDFLSKERQLCEKKLKH